jgi:hypothetical protein
MEAADVQPTRLARAKHKLRDLLEARKGLSTGLIAYSGSAHLVMPLTRDERIVSAMVEDLTPELMPADGDALAEALQLADSVLERAGVPGSVVVMTDAVAPAQAENIAAATPGFGCGDDRRCRTRASRKHRGGHVFFAGPVPRDDGSRRRGGRGPGARGIGTRCASGAVERRRG